MCGFDVSEKACEKTSFKFICLYIDIISPAVTDFAILQNVVGLTMQIFAGQSLQKIWLSLFSCLRIHCATQQDTEQHLIRQLR